MSARHELPMPVLDEPVLRLDNIQGDVVPGFHRMHQVLVFLAIEDPSAAALWIRDVAARITTGRHVVDVKRVDREARGRGDRVNMTAVWRNVALGPRGLRLLRLDPAHIADEAFRAGMAARSTTLGDPRDTGRPGHRGGWEVGGPSTTADIMLNLASDDFQSLVDEVNGLDGPEHGMRVIHVQDGHLLPGEVEHFGFKDGISQPAIRGRATDDPRDFIISRAIPPNNPLAGRFAKPGQPLIPPGQFVFGYGSFENAGERTALNQRGRDAIDQSQGPDWSFDGSLLVFRQLRQDVFAFRRFLATEVTRLGAVPELAGITMEILGARLVGRWKNGVPLVRSPDRDDVSQNRFEINHFRFLEDAASLDAVDQDGRVPVSGAAADADGDRCPRSAHIRKVNARDAPTDQGGEEAMRRLLVLRRGIPYGGLLPAEADSPDTDPAHGRRGLLFICYQASITEQFEFLNNRWMNRTGVPEKDAGHDLIVGQNNRLGAGNERQCPIRFHGADHIVGSIDNWVLPTGGGYFFVPSLETLRRA